MLNSIRRPVSVFLWLGILPVIPLLHCSDLDFRSDIFIAVDYPYIYSIGYHFDGEDGYDDLRIYDMSPPEPEIFSYVSLPGYTSWGCGLGVKGDAVYIADDSGLYVVDVTDRQDPELVEVQKMGGMNCTDNYDSIESENRMRIYGDYLYILIETDLHIFSIKNRFATKYTGKIYMNDKDYYVAGNNTLVTANSDSILVSDFSNKLLPKLINQYQLSAVVPGFSGLIGPYLSGKNEFIYSYFKGELAVFTLSGFELTFHTVGLIEGESTAVSSSSSSSDYISDKGGYPIRNGRIYMPDRVINITNLARPFVQDYYSSLTTYGVTDHFMFGIFYEVDEETYMQWAPLKNYTPAKWNYINR